MDRRIIEAAEDTLGIILGGGRGTRLHPLTEERSKPAVPLGGKYRLIDIPISNCINSQIRRIFVLTQFNSASLNRHVSLSYKFDSFSRGFVEVLAAEQTAEHPDWFQGTADAVRHNLRHFVRWAPEHYLILSGDQLYKMDYRSLLRYHIQKGAQATIGTVRVGREQAKSFGIMDVDPGGRIVDFVEKPKQDAILDRLAVSGDKAEGLGLEPKQDNWLASMGIYVFNQDVMLRMLQGSGGQDFGHDVIPEAIRGFKLFAYFFDGYWEDIGTIHSFFEANLMMTQKFPPFDIYDADYPIFTNARFLPSSKFYNSSIKSTLIAEGSILENAEITDSVIGVRSIIQSGARLHRTVVMGADYYETPSELAQTLKRNEPELGIGPGTVIREAIIDKNARIGAGAQIVNERGLKEADGDGWCIRDGIIIIKKGAVIRENTVI
ncbi:MAG: glucose-1-phosphate adenylyltransferase [Candidatus Riflebacteria bacterium]|nr:glucose-1-phosphate adenylyltransferase [Candidatus Riflebacteria bacterium]